MPRQPLPEPTWEADDHPPVPLELESRLGPHPLPSVETWAKNQAIAAALHTTAEQALQMVDEGGPTTDQTGEHDVVDPLDSIGRLWLLQRAELVGKLVSASMPGGPLDLEGDIVTHAMAILPHVGPEATVAYISGALGKLSACEPHPRGKDLAEQ